MFLGTKQQPANYTGFAEYLSTRGSLGQKAWAKGATEYILVSAAATVGNDSLNLAERLLAFPRVQEVLSASIRR